MVGTELICISQAPSTCPQTQINSLSDNHGLTYSLNDQVSYNIRDSLMLLYTKGQEYITYYNVLGQIALDSGLITRKTLASYYNFAIDVQKASTMLMRGQSNDVPVTRSFKSNAIRFIENFRAIINDPLIEDILDEIERDLIEFEGLTVTQILSKL